VERGEALEDGEGEREAGVVWCISLILVGWGGSGTFCDGLGCRI